MLLVRTTSISEQQEDAKIKWLARTASVCCPPCPLRLLRPEDPAPRPSLYFSSPFAPSDFFLACRFSHATHGLSALLETHQRTAVALAGKRLIDDGTRGKSSSHVQLNTQKILNIKTQRNKITRTWGEGVPLSGRCYPEARLFLPCCGHHEARRGSRTPPSGRVLLTPASC